MEKLTQIEEEHINLTKKKLQLEGEINENEKKLDMHVYEIYGLSDREIKEVKELE